MKQQLIEGNNTLSLCPATMIAVAAVEYEKGVTSQFVVRFKRKDEGIPT